MRKAKRESESLRKSECEKDRERERVSVRKSERE